VGAEEMDVVVDEVLDFEMDVAAVDMGAVE